MKNTISENDLVNELFQKSINNNKVDLPTPNKETLNISKLSGDASTRKYYRISSNKHSMVACLDTPYASSLTFFHELQTFLKEHRIPVPEIYDYCEKNGYILEEDLGDTTLLSLLANSNSSNEYGIYKKCLDILIDIHSIDLTPHLNNKNCCFTQYKFDKEKFLSEVEITIEYFIRKYLNICLTHNEYQNLLNSFNAICEELEKEKMVFTHRDYHSRNIMIKNDKLLLIDFQDARPGIPQYDLASLLEDCYYQLNDANIASLKKYYWDNFANKNSDQDYQKFNRLYDLMTIQRVFKAIGSFTYIFHTRKDKRYLKYVGYAVEKIKRKLENYPEFESLRNQLIKYYYEN